MADSADTTDAPVRPGDILLGKYQVEHVLGQGGMGVVVAAKHLELGELFAIKFLLPDAVKSQAAVSRFVREARAAARLHSPHVARVHDVGRLESGMPYMVMEHLDGRDLAKLLKRRGALPEAEAAALLLEACEAITEAHALGIVHRDIKPSNLFLAQRRNGKPCLKVLDFGISKQLDAQAADQTKTGTMMGSLLYMSPEQMSDAKTADARSDIWSLGVVLYELTTGKLPFNGETVPNLIFEVISSEPAPPSQVRPGLTVKLDEVVLRCLCKKPEQRYASVEELAAALRALAGLRSERPGPLHWSAEEQSGLKKVPTDEVRATATTAPANENFSLPLEVRETSPSSPSSQKDAAGALTATASIASPISPALVTTETLEPRALPTRAAPETMPERAPGTEPAEPPIASTQSPLSTTANRPPPSRRSGIALAAGAAVLAAGVGLTLYLRQPATTMASGAAPLSPLTASTAVPSAPEAPAIAPPGPARAETLAAPMEAPSEQAAGPVASAAGAPTSSASARAASSPRRGGAAARPSAAPTTTPKAAPPEATPAPPSPPTPSAKPRDRLW